MRTPITAVIMPPARKEMRPGARLEMSLAGLTTLAAMLVVSVATESMIREMMITGAEPTRATTSVGSQMVLPKMIGVALVTAMPMKQKRVIVVGRPRAW